MAPKPATGAPRGRPPKNSTTAAAAAASSRKQQPSTAAAAGKKGPGRPRQSTGSTREAERALEAEIETMEVEGEGDGSEEQEQEEEEEEEEEEDSHAHSIRPELLTRILHFFFEKEGSRITRDANEAVGKYVDVFVRESIARAAEERRGGFLEVEDLEKVAPQLLLDL